MTTKTAKNPYARFKTVRGLLSDKKRWCQNHYALAGNNRSVDESAPNACRWCLSGALEFIYGGISYDKWAIAREKIRSAMLDLYNVTGITTFNDHHKYEDVAKVLRKAGV